MLGKLLKYEIKATARIFLPLYGLIILLALINKLFLFQDSSGYLNIPKTISMIVYVTLMVALVVMTLVVIIQRFYKNLFCDEGYLSFTLPVKAHSHIDAKMITTLMWSIISLIVSVFSIFILLVNSETIENFSKFCMEIGQFFTENGSIAYAILAECIILLIVGILSSTLQIYASITLGNMCSKHKLLAGFGAYIGFGIIQQTVMSIIMNINNPNYIFIESNKTYLSAMNTLNAISQWLLIMIVFSVIFGAAFYFFTDWMLNRKLNID